MRARRNLPPLPPQQQLEAYDSSIAGLPDTMQQDSRSTCIPHSSTGQKKEKAKFNRAGRTEINSGSLVCPQPTDWPRVISGKPRLHCSCAAGEMLDLTARDLPAVTSREGHAQGLLVKNELSTWDLRDQSCLPIAWK